ncbi:hypothetical protein KIN20_026120 [Parelaphostrongylus tenuis]|uniref:Uncharacterized protein n=1 Tax=Parelaphostrongylus tenuis TaxID=148309 RepID=A0AAD5N9I9_PARTN|nr:hypothetical protein KIN20_026120 [Parelaphostrongylus tenuis]
MVLILIATRRGIDPIQHSPVTNNECPSLGSLEIVRRRAQPLSCNMHGENEKRFECECTEISTVKRSCDENQLKQNSEDAFVVVVVPPSEMLRILCIANYSKHTSDCSPFLQAVRL